MGPLLFLVAVILFVVSVFHSGHHLLQWGLAALAAGHLLGGSVEVPLLRRKPPPR